MANEATNVDIERALETLATQGPTRAADMRDSRGESRELWRVISADGSTRLLETAAAAPVDRSPGIIKVDALRSARASKPAAASPSRGRLITPLRRETKQDEKVSLADLFEAVAARHASATADTSSLEHLRTKPPQTAGHEPTPRDPAADAVALPHGDVPPPADPSAPRADSPMDAGLKQTVDVWPALSASTRAAILGLIGAASTDRTTVA